MSMKGIDVSHWQGAIDWSKVKASGIQFAIIKAGGSDAGFYKDSRFEANYSGCKSAGIHVGAYYFVGKGCTSKANGEADARRFIEQMKGKQFDMPVYIDFEAPSASNVNGNTQAVIGFCKVLENAGYFAGIYASDISGFKERLHASALKQFTWWVARYGSKPVFATASLGIWQYSSTGKVTGINGNVDMDICYVDFPSTIKSKGFNGYSKSVHVTPAKPAKPESKPASTSLKVGDTVKVLNPVTYTGQKFKLWYPTYNVIEVKGDRVVIGKGKVVTAPVKASNLKKV